MYEQEQVLYNFLLGYGRMQALSIADEQFTQMPIPGLAHPAWQFGHLNVSADYALRLLGQPARCPKEWGALFNPGTKATPEAGKYPSKKELVGMWKEQHEAVVAALPQADPTALEQPHDLPFEIIKKAFPRRRDLLAHLISTHEAGHLGLLAAWRRAQGLPVIF